MRCYPSDFVLLFVSKQCFHRRWQEFTSQDGSSDILVETLPPSEKAQQARK